MNFRKRVNNECFDRLENLKDYQNDNSWLNFLSEHIESIVTFGCWSPEPIALLWILNATEVQVVEIEERYLERPKEILRNIQDNYPECLENRLVIFQPSADMVTVDLPKDYFDLAYCERVLTNFENDSLTQLAIRKMASVVKSGGWVIAVESMPDKTGHPRPRKEISRLFDQLGLEERNIPGAPEDAFCFLKT